MTDKQPPFVIHVSEMANYPNAVYIGRKNGRKYLKRSKWANQYTVIEFGRSAAIRHYRAWIAVGGDGGELHGINELAGKPLACLPLSHLSQNDADSGCHGQIKSANCQ